MPQILLIWDDAQASPTFYRLTAGSDIAQLAVASAGQYINSGDLPEDHAIYKLNDALENMPSTPCGEPILGPFETVVVCLYHKTIRAKVCRFPGAKKS